MLQNHSNITLPTICVHCILVSNEHILIFYNVPKLRYGPLTLNIEMNATNLSRVTVLVICVYALNRKIHAELLLHSTFQT